MNDLRQSSLLFKVLHEERPGDLRLAWQALVARKNMGEKGEGRVRADLSI